MRRAQATPAARHGITHQLAADRAARRNKLQILAGVWR
jgi:hypothetical protein